MFNIIEPWNGGIGTFMQFGMLEARAGGMEGEMNAMRAALMDRDANLARLQNEARMQVDNAERARVPFQSIVLP